MTRTRLVIAALATSVSCAAALAQKASEKPRVPPGVDPGGITVAIIGNGIDYTNPDIARRLARDGEGEIVGWDFLDGDRRPFERCGLRSDPPGHCNETPIAIVTSAKVRIVPLRAGLEKPQSLVEAVRLASQVDARIILVALPVAPPSRFVEEAAAWHSRPLFVATVKADPRQPPYKLATAANHIMANADADSRDSISAAVTAILSQAVTCAADARRDAQAIRDCAVGISPVR